MSEHYCQGPSPAGQSTALAAAGAISALLATALVYWQGLSGPFIVDDGSVLDPLLAASARGDWEGYLVSHTGPLGRPVSMLSFMANGLTSGTSHWAVKATNVFIHLVCGTLAMLLAHRLLRSTSMPGGHRVLAVVIGAAWMLHPVQISTVLYAVQRMTELATMFTFLSLTLTLRGVELPLRHAIPWLTAALVAGTLAGLSKEIGLNALPLSLLAVASVRPHSDNTCRREVLAFLAVATALLGLAYAVYFSVQYSERLHDVFLARGWTVQERILTETRVLLLYIQQILAPSSKVLSFHYDWLVPSRGLLEPASTLLSCVFVLAATAFALLGPTSWLLVRLGVGWFLTGHLLEGSMWPLELAFEHRNYLPAFGGVLVVVGSILQLQSRRFVRAVLLGSWVALLSLVSAGQVAHWATPATFAVHFYEVRPDSATASSNLAELLDASGQPELAVEVLAPHASLGARLQSLHVACRAELPSLDKRLAQVRDAPFHVDAYATTAAIEVARLVLEGRCTIPSVDLAGLLADLVTEAQFVHARDRLTLTLYKAHLLWEAGLHENALRSLVSSVPGPPATHLLLAADWQSALGRCEEARTLIQRVAKDAHGSNVQRMVEAAVDEIAERCTPLGNGRKEGGPRA